MPKTKTRTLTARTAAADFSGRIMTRSERDPSFVPGDDQTPADAPKVERRRCVITLDVDGGGTEGVNLAIDEALSSSDAAQLDALLVKLLDHAATVAGFSDD